MRTGISFCCPSACNSTLLHLSELPVSLVLAHIMQPVYSCRVVVWELERKKICCSKSPICTCIWCTVFTRFWKPTLANLVLGDCKCTSPGQCYHHAKLLLPPKLRSTLHRFKENMGCFLASVFSFLFFFFFFKLQWTPPDTVDSKCGYQLVSQIKSSST